MENAYHPEKWHDFYVMLGTSAAALIGLLFVVTSLHLEEIVNNRVYRARARNNAIHLLLMLVQAGAFLVPQPSAVLGAELIAINLCGWYLPLSFTYNAFFKNRTAGKGGGVSIYRGIFYHVGYLLGVAGGVSMINQSRWGMYLVAVSYLSFFVSVIWNAWTIMLGVGLTASLTDSKRETTGKT